MTKSKPLVAVIMGSKSDWETMRHCVDTLDELGIANEHRVLSAHRTPDATADFARKAEQIAACESSLPAREAQRIWPEYCGSHLAARSWCSDSIKASGT